MTAWLAGTALGVAVVLAGPARPRWRRPASGSRATGGAGRLLRPVLALLAGVAVALFLGGPVGVVAGAVVVPLAWQRLAAAEPAADRRRRAAVAHDLPHLVGLLATVLRGGAAPEEAVRTVCAALPGPAADRLQRVPDRLAVGVDPARVWGSLAADPELAALGRALARSHETGAPVAEAVARLAAELRDRGRAEVEGRARAVGVRAALPLGLCLLPSFLLLGIVPLVAGLLSGLAW